MPPAAQVQKLLEADSGGGRSRRRGTIRRMGTQRLALGGRGAAKGEAEMQRASRRCDSAAVAPAELPAPEAGAAAPTQAPSHRDRRVAPSDEPSVQAEAVAA